MMIENTPAAETGEDAGRVWRLRIYVVDDTPRARVALENLRRLCQEHLSGRFEIEVVDVEKDPEAAMRDDIVAIPTVIRSHPLPARTLVGTLTDRERALGQLDLRERPAPTENGGNGR